MKCKLCKKNEVDMYSKTRCWPCLVKTYNTPKKWRGGL